MLMYNSTAHPIQIVNGSTYVREIRGFIGGDIVRTLPKEKIMLSVKKESVYLHGDYGFPAYEKVWVEEPDNPSIIHSRYGGIIVSAWYAQEAERAGYDISRLWIVCDPVYEDRSKSRMIGVRGLSKW